MGMKEAVYERLSTDAELLAALPGGIYASWEIEEISRTNTPNAFDASRELLPTGMLVWQNRTPYENMPAQMGALREGFAFLAYDKFGSDQLDAARDRVILLMRDWWPADIRGWGINFLGALPDAEDDALKATLAITTFEAITRREYA